MLVTVQSEGSQLPLIIAPGISKKSNLAWCISEALGRDYPVYTFERLSHNGVYISDLKETSRIYARQIEDASLAGRTSFSGFRLGRRSPTPWLYGCSYKEGKSGS